MNNPDTHTKFKFGDKVKKTKRNKNSPEWRGTICGFYSTEGNPEGYAVESHYEPGSVQIYPASMLEKWADFYDEFPPDDLL